MLTLSPTLTPSSMPLVLESLGTASPLSLLCVHTKESPVPVKRYRHSQALDVAILRLLDLKRRARPTDLRLLLNRLAVQHGKTLVASVATSAWFLGWNPDSYVVVIGNTHEFATDRIGRPARDLFEAIAPWFGLEIDSTSTASDRWGIKGHRGGFFCAGIGGRIEGRSINLGILDDTIGRLADADNSRKRDADWEWYQAQFYPRLAPGASVICTMSPWHKDDIGFRLERASQSGEGMPCDVLDMPALALKPDEYASGADPLGRAPGEALWPEVRDREFLLQARANIGSRMFSARFQGRPLDAEGALFQREWFRRRYDVVGDTVRLYDANGAFLVKYAMHEFRRIGFMDPAFTLGGGDYTAIGSFFVGPKAELIVAHMERHQVKSGHDDLLVATQKRFGLHVIGIECVGAQSIIADLARLRGLPIREVTRGRGEGKALRAQAAVARFEAGMIWLPRSASWLDAFESELLEFSPEGSTGAHDDQVDVLSDAATAVLELMARGDGRARGVRV